MLYDLGILFKIISRILGTPFQGLVSTRIRVRKCTSHNAPVICNHCARPPPYGDGRGIVGLKCRAVTLEFPRSAGLSAGLVTLRKYTPMEINIIKSRAMTLSRSPQCRALMDEKPLSPPLPRRWGGGWGAVVTNDWCINTTVKS